MFKVLSICKVNRKY